MGGFFFDCGVVGERNLLDFGLEVLFFFGCALDCAGVLCVVLCVWRRVYDRKKIEDRWFEMRE
jgi:hypothetical protein